MPKRMGVEAAPKEALRWNTVNAFRAFVVGFRRSDVEKRRKKNYHRQSLNSIVIYFMRSFPCDSNSTADICFMTFSGLPRWIHKHKHIRRSPTQLNKPFLALHWLHLSHRSPHKLYPRPRRVNRKHDFPPDQTQPRRVQLKISNVEQTNERQQQQTLHPNAGYTHSGKWIILILYFQTRGFTFNLKPEKVAEDSSTDTISFYRESR